MATEGFEPAKKSWWQVMSINGFTEIKANSLGEAHEWARVRYGTYNIISIIWLRSA